MGEEVIHTGISPADLVEKLTGVRPRSGVCIICKKNLTEQDTDHSVCNSCWDELPRDGDEDGDTEY